MAAQLNRSKVVPLVILALACAALAFYFNGTHKNVSTISSGLEEPVTTKTVPTQQAQSTSEANVEASTQKHVARLEQLGAARGELMAWSTARGYASTSQLATYDGYSIEALQEMAKNGDVQALQSLASKAISAGDHEKAVIYYWQAATAGSTTALDGLATLVQPNYILDATESSNRPLVLESLAIYKTAELRGDHRVSKIGGRLITDSYERRFGKFTLSTEEQNLIENRANQIYGDLLAAREKAGLDGFENSTPAIFKDDPKPQ